MDISGMTEEEQLQAALRLSMAEPIGVPASAWTVPTPAPAERGKRAFASKVPEDVLAPLDFIAKKPKAESGEDGHFLGAAEVSTLRQVLFGRKPDNNDVARWLNAGFEFCDTEGLEYGLLQRQGGPCGVLAPVQGFLLKYLLFGEASWHKIVEGKPLALHEEDAAALGDNPRAAALSFALASALFHSTQASSYTVCRLALAGGASSGSALADLDALSISVRRFSRIVDVQQHLEAGARSWLSSTGGVLSFVCSVLLSRGIELVRADMDDAELPLIARFGHCSQELVNLLMIGEATSGVFDGAKWLGDDPATGIQCRGVESERIGVPILGLLSEMEGMRYVSVGTLFKNPEFPLWVVQSSTHYTLLFSTRRSDSQLSEGARIEQLAKKTFADHSLDEGLAMSDALGKMLAELGIAAQEPLARSELVREDIFIWTDFKRWVLTHFGFSENSTGNGVSGASSGIQLYLYDGQDPPGPTLRSVQLETSDIDPAFAGGSEDDAFAAALHTRWPNATVSVQILLSALSGGSSSSRVVDPVDAFGTQSQGSAPAGPVEHAPSAGAEAAAAAAVARSKEGMVAARLARFGAGG